MRIGLRPLVQQVKSFFNSATYRNDSIRYQSPFGSAYADEWQKGGGGTPSDPLALPAVEACINAISSSVASMPMHHQTETRDAALKRVWDSDFERILRKPNDYQTGANFLLNLVRSELTHGNGYAVRLTINGKDQLHLLNPHSVQALVGSDDNGYAVYYRIGSDNGVIDFDADIFIPQRDMLHLRRNYDKDPLKGVSPIRAAAASIAAGNAINAHQASFFGNMSRPSGVLKTDAQLTEVELQQLRAAFDNQSKRWQSGGLPILTSGLSYEQLALTAADAQLVDTYRMSLQDVARVFGVPLPVIGELSGATYSNTELLIQHWLSTSLNYVLREIEEAFEDLFGFGDGQYKHHRLNFDTQVLLRSDFKTRLDGLTSAVRGGVYSVNEARRMEHLPPVEYGDDVRVQQQDVPLAAWHIEQETAQAQQPEIPQEPIENSLTAFEKAFTGAMK
jgi:HK97 family phage portal protein